MTNKNREPNHNRSHESSNILDKFKKIWTQIENIIIQKDLLVWYEKTTELKKRLFLQIESGGSMM